MNTDFRVDVGFFDHHKTRRLIAALGLPAAWSLLRLWAFAAVNKPSGDLRGMTPADIAAACHFDGPAEEFVDQLCALRLLARKRRFFSIWEWDIHQPFAVNAPARQQSARKAAEARWKRSINDDATRMRDACDPQCDPHATRNAPAKPAKPAKPSLPEEADSSATREDASAKPAVLTFPTIGRGPQAWALTEGQIAEWAGLYPGLDVLAECRKALAWVTANKRLTARGMPKFLVNWFNRSTDSPRGRSGQAEKLTLNERNKLATATWGEE